MTRTHVATYLASAIFMFGLLLSLDNAVPAGASSPNWSAPVSIRGVPQTSDQFGGTIDKLSCPAARSCTGVGTYDGRKNSTVLFATTETHGVWGVAKVIHYTGGQAAISTLACWAAGSCVMGGMTTLANGADEGYLASEIHGVWQRATVVSDAGEVLGSSFGVSQVSCLPSGACTAVGTNSAGSYYLTIVRGVAGPPTPISPSVTGDDPGTVSSASFISCPSSGNCVIAGTYINTKTNPTVGGSNGGVFTMTESAGVWATPQELAGVEALDTETTQQSEGPSVTTLSCGGPGSCALGGSYGIPHSSIVHYAEAYFATEVAGVWSSATEVPGTAALNVHGIATVTNADCEQVNSCTMIGSYGDVRGRAWSFVLREIGGHWTAARRMPVAKPITGYVFSSLSCANATNCVANGTINANVGVRAIELHGVWSPATSYNVLAKNNTYYSNQLNATSCSTSGYCVSGGSYETSAASMTVSGDLTPGHMSPYVAVVNV